jgi:thiosulfate/3-mercaptopyruvate sulfurtransferase
LGHVPGAVLFDWKEDINDPTSRNILSRDSCERLLQQTGINDDSILTLYGDFNNWFAALRFGFSNIMDIKTLD